MKSEPELAEPLEAVEGVEVTMAERVRNRVEIRAEEQTGVSKSPHLRAFRDR